MVKTLPAMQETWAWSLRWEDPLEEGMASHSSILLGFPGGSDGKESACNAGDLGSISGLGRSPEGGDTNHSSIVAWRIPRDCSPLGSFVHGILQARILEWVAIPFSRRSSQPKD